MQDTYHKINSSSSLSDENRKVIFTLPIYVPLSLNPDEETDEQKLLRYGKFEKLPEIIKYKLADFGTSQKIQAIGRKYAFELLRLANITRLVREYYFGEVRLEDFPREIERRMSVSLLTAQEIARYIRQEIIDWDPWAEYLAKLPKATAREILVKYPKVAEQEITDGFIEFKDHPDDIFDPSIKNWLRDYVLHLGQVGHTSVDRMNYLFHSENTKNLSSTEREKLGIILKSFDENVPLAIDVENQEVVFDVSSEPRSMPQTRQLQSKQQTEIKQERIIPQAQMPPQENFIKPYSRQELKPEIQPRPIENKIPATRYPLPATSDKIQYANPYPAPGTHEIPSQPEMAGASPIKMKGFSEGSAAAAPPKPETRFVPPQSFPTRPKNIIYPHYGVRREEKPEPKIEGNIVDLRGDQQ